MSDDDFSSIENELFFGDFEQFADTLNLCLNDTPWRIHGAFAFRIEGVVAAAIDDTYFLFQ